MWVCGAVGYGWTVETDRLSRALTSRVAPRLVALALGAACILMGLNDSNREAFRDLVSALERH